MLIKEFIRKCPECNKNLYYSHYSNFSIAQKNNTLCRSCSQSKRVGEKNAFFGKKHSPETVEKLSVFFKNYNYTEQQREQAKNQLAKVSNSRPIYDIWLEKYGKEIADFKLTELKNKQSLNSSGDKNGMFGKPSPQGSGNGWSGWYKEWFFRSLRELSFMINVLEAQQLKWELPNKNYKIPYLDYNGKTRTYFPDFIVNGVKIIEIKPSKLHNSPKVLAKKKAAENFCKNRNMVYELIDPIILSEEEIKKLYLDEKIKFIDKYDKKFRKKYL